MSASLSFLTVGGGWSPTDLLPQLPMQNGDAGWGRVKNPPILPKGYDPRPPTTGTPGGKSIQDILSAPEVGMDKALGDLLLGSDGKFDILGGLAGDAGDIAAATVGPVMKKAVWFIGGALLLGIGLWALLRGGPVVAGVKEGLAAVRAGK